MMAAPHGERSRCRLTVTWIRVQRVDGVASRTCWVTVERRALCRAHPAQPWRRVTAQPQRGEPSSLCTRQADEQVRVTGRAARQAAVDRPAGREVGMDPRRRARRAAEPAADRGGSQRQQDRDREDGYETASAGPSANGDLPRVVDQDAERGPVGQLVKLGVHTAQRLLTVLVGALHSRRADRRAGRAPPGRCRTRSGGDGPAPGTRRRSPMRRPRACNPRIDGRTPPVAYRNGHVCSRQRCGRTTFWQTTPQRLHSTSAV